MEYEITYLPKDKWKGTIIPIKYTTDKYYDVQVNKTEKGYNVDIEKKDFLYPITHTPEEYNFPDKLYKDYWVNAYISYSSKPKSISNLYFAGQRLVSPGGLPVALETGRKAVQYLCKDTDTIFQSKI